MVIFYIHFGAMQGLTKNINKKELLDLQWMTNVAFTSSLGGQRNWDSVNKVIFVVGTRIYVEW